MSSPRPSLMTARKRPCPSCGGGLSRSDRDGDWCWSCRYIGRVLGRALEALERPAARERMLAAQNNRSSDNLPEQPSRPPVRDLVGAAVQAAA
jgi:hypothetical protein